MKKFIVTLTIAAILCSILSFAYADTTVVIETVSNGDWSGRPAVYISRASGVAKRWGISCHHIVSASGTPIYEGSTRAYLYSREDANRVTTSESLDMTSSEPTRCYEYITTPVAGRGYKVVAKTNDSSVFSGGYYLSYHHLP